jgi:hypothetical protein
MDTMKDIITQTFEVSDLIKDERNLNDILNATVQEVGELATEISIHTGYRMAEPGADGVVGEAIDSIVCLLDIIRRYDPTITREQIEEIASAKLIKWVTKTQKRDANK